MSGFRFLPLILAALFFAGCTDSDTGPVADTSSPAPQRVLFVGNSFSYYNNGLHDHYRSLVREVQSGRGGRARMLAISGGQLPEHRAGLMSLLRAAEWDVVVLQGYSLGPISDELSGPFRQAAHEYAAAIRKRGAEPVFFMTWAYTGKPEMTAALDDAYSSIGRELDARVVPVGRAFARVTRERPDIDLRMADAKHPTLAGTYLAACVFFAVLQGKSPVGMDYDAGLERDTVGYLQRVAYEVVNDDVANKSR